MVKIILAVMVTMLIQGCFVIEWRIKKSLKYNYIDNYPEQQIKLKLNGFYYMRKKDDEGRRRLYGCFFYANGKVLFALDGYLDSMTSNDDIKNLLRSQYRIKFNGKKDFVSSSFWTNYVTKHDSIDFERIHPWQDYPHYLYSGNIVNDTTFIIRNIRQVYGIKDYQKSKESDTFHFKQFLPKPDSFDIKEYSNFK